MSELRNHIQLEALKEPREAVDYLWAPTGNLAFAHAPSSVVSGLQRAVREGWRTFKWAIPRPLYINTAPNETTMIQSTVVFVVEQFHHRKYHSAHAARFASLVDQERFLREMPHLAVEDRPLKANGEQD